MIRRPLINGFKFAIGRWGYVLRLGVWYAVFYFTTFFLFSYIGYRFIRHSMELEDLDLIQAQTTDFRDFYRDDPLAGFSSYFSASHRAIFDIVYVRIVTPDERKLLSDYPLAEREAIAAQGMEPTPSGYRKVQELPLKSGGSIPVRVFTSRVSENVSIEIARNERSHKRLMEAFMALSVVVAIPLALIGLVGGALFTKWSLHPVSQVNRAILAILKTGSFEERVHTAARSGELGDLVNLCNRLLAHIERLMRSMSQSLDNVSHDLRTPLTRLRISAESALLKEGEGANTAHREGLADCLEETEQILAMLNTIMEVTEAESDLLELHRETVRVEEFMHQLTDLYEFVAEEKAIRLRTVVTPSLVAWVDVQRLFQALGNLVENAIKYTPEKGHVVISAREENRRTIFAVRDDGIGIAANEQEIIWDRLYRSDVSRHEKGLGLGLSMVKAIAVAHGGSVRLKSRVGEGSEFVMEIPRESGHGGD